MDSAEPRPFSSVSPPEPELGSPEPLPSSERSSLQLELGSHEPLAHTPMATSHLSEQPVSLPVVITQRREDDVMELSSSEDEDSRFSDMEPRGKYRKTRT
jgi:hypothetical protein